MLPEMLNIEKMTDLMQANLAANFIEVNIRDKAFTCYYFIRTGRYDITKEFIKSTANEIGISINSCLDLAFWLWIVGEYFNATKDFDELDISKCAITYCIECVKTNWNKDLIHWLDSSVSGVFACNISILYTALNSVNKFLNDSKLEELLAIMIDYIFTMFIKNGEYVGEKDHIDVFGDMSIIAVPFGVVSLDDLIFKRTIGLIEERLLTEGVCFSEHDFFHNGNARAELNCLLSWYYSEMGYIEHSEWLLKQVEGLLLQTSKEENLTYILYAIAVHNLNFKKQSDDKSLFKGVDILHKPLGENDPQNRVTYERYPNYPEVNDSVYLMIKTRPYNPYQKVYLKYCINGKRQPRLLMSIKTSSEGERYWQVCIGKFNFNDRVDYTFEVHFGGVKTVSPQYGFNVRKWYAINEIEYIDYTDDEVALLFKPVGNLRKMPCLCIKKFKEDSLKFSFSMEQCEEPGKKQHYYVKTMGRPDKRVYSFRLGKLNLEYNDNNISFKVLRRKGEHILQSYKANNVKLIDLLIDGDDVHKVRFNLLTESAEKIFGMGERFSNIEFQGLDIENYVYNKYKDHGLKTYLPIPFFISSKGYGIYFDISTYSKFRFGTTITDLAEMEINLDSKKQDIDFYVFTGKPKKILGEYTELTGKPALPPKWCFGLWISSNSWNSQEDIYEQLDNTQKYEIPTSAIVIEQWSDEATYYIFNGAEYDEKPGEYYFKYEDFKFSKDKKWPDPKKMVDFLHKLGIRVLLWQVPFLAYMGSSDNNQRHADEITMLKNNYHVKYKDGKEYRSVYYWFGHSLVPDFTNPEAGKWWMNKRLYLIRDIGIDGFKIDGGECILNSGLVFHNGKTEEEMRNEYPNEYAKLYFDFVQQHASDEGAVFSRTGYKGAQRFPLHWAGDDESTFKAFREAVNAGLSSGISGISFWGWDIAGFSGEIPTPELYLRSTQMSVFCPIMQYHSEKMVKRKQDRTPWNIAERTQAPYIIDIFKRYIDLRMNILPYIYQQAIISSKTGIPMMRAMFLEYPDDKNCIAMAQQYMFGESILVAPVVDEGVNHKDVYLPEGKWMNFFNGEVVDGGKLIKVEADIGRIPVYIKENSIIPLNLSDECTLFSHVGNDMECYKNLCFLFHITNYIQYEFIDDLGNCINVKASIQGGTISVNLEGNYTESIMLIFRNTSEVKNVLHKGRVMSETKTIDTLDPESYINLPDSLIIKL